MCSWIRFIWYLYNIQCICLYVCMCFGVMYGYAGSIVCICLFVFWCMYNIHCICLDNIYCICLDVLRCDVWICWKQAISRWQSAREASSCIHCAFSVSIFLSLFVVCCLSFIVCCVVVFLLYIWLCIYFSFVVFLLSFVCCFVVFFLCTLLCINFSFVVCFVVFCCFCLLFCCFPPVYIVPPLYLSIFYYPIFVSVLLFWGLAFLVVYKVLLHTHPFFLLIGSVCCCCCWCTFVFFKFQVKLSFFQICI